MTRRSRSRRPPSLDLSLSSGDSSHSTTSSASSSSSPEPLEFDDDSPGSSSPTAHHPPPPPSADDCADAACEPMRICAAGPYCFKQPTLAEVLSNKAPAPYTLSAFMAYLSQNHCLETLEFTMDANRYRKHYQALHPPAAAQQAASPKDCAYVRRLWRRLLDAYIVPDGPREVNLPCSIRDQILAIPNQRAPPPPECLDPAVDIVHELMQESVLVPFLSGCQAANAFAADHGSPVPPAPWQGPSSNNGSADSVVCRQGGGLSLDERMLRHHSRYGRSTRDQSPPSPVDYVPAPHSYAGPARSMPRSHSPFSAALGWHSRQQSSSLPLAPPPVPAPSSSWTSSDSMMTMDDSGFSTPSWISPMTPPTTPPASDVCGPASSPKRSGSEKGWKRMAGGLGRGLGFGRKKEYW